MMINLTQSQAPQTLLYKRLGADSAPHQSHFDEVGDELIYEREGLGHLKKVRRRLVIVKEVGFALMITEQEQERRTRLCFFLLVVREIGQLLAYFSFCYSTSNNYGGQ